MHPPSFLKMIAKVGAWAIKVPLRKKNYRFRSQGRVMRGSMNAEGVREGEGHYRCV